MPLIPHAIFRAIPHADIIGTSGLPNAGMLNAHTHTHLFGSRLLPMGTHSWCVHLLDMMRVWSLGIGSECAQWLDVVWSLAIGAISCSVRGLGTIQQRPIGAIAWLMGLLRMMALGGLDGQVWRVAGQICHDSACHGATCHGSTCHGSVSRHTHTLIPRLPLALSIQRIVCTLPILFIARARLIQWTTAIHNANKAKAQVSLWRAPWCAQEAPADGCPGWLPIWCLIWCPGWLLRPIWGKTRGVT